MRTMKAPHVLDSHRLNARYALRCRGLVKRARSLVDELREAFESAHARVFLTPANLPDELRLEFHQFLLGKGRLPEHLRQHLQQAINIVTESRRARRRQKPIRPDMHLSPDILQPRGDLQLAPPLSPPQQHGGRHRG